MIVVTTAANKTNGRRGFLVYDTVLLKMATLDKVSVTFYVILATRSKPTIARGCNVNISYIIWRPVGQEIDGRFSAVKVIVSHVR